MAVGPTKDPGATYVALSEGGSTFNDHRANIEFNREIHTKESKS